VLILALDTSSPAGSLAVLRETKVIGVVSTWTDETYSSRLFRHLEFLLSEMLLGLEKIDLFAVDAGPGSFTGLRVGLAAVKGWAEVYQKPIAAISGLEAVAVQARSSAAVLVPVLDARRGQVYFGFYARDSASERLVLEGEERVMTPEEFWEALLLRSRETELAIVTPPSELAASMVSRSSELREAFRVEEVSGVLAPVIGRLGYDRAQRGELTDSLTLDANYVRRSDAEVDWKGSRRP
jgi:tRNA threonylcarbamoyladenosine biosynthesis protein TsaB